MQGGGEETLREMEKRYRALFEDSKDAMYVTDCAGKLVDFNQAFAELFGYTKQELIGMDVRDIYCEPSDRYKFQKELDEHGSVKDYELKLRKLDGTQMDCLATASVWRGDDGSILGYQGITRDVTAQKRAQQMLESFAHQLVEAQAAERQKISRERHDQVGQVLTGLKLLLGMMARSLAGNMGAELRQAQELVDELMERVCDISLDLRPPMLDELGLLPALLWHFEHFTVQTGVRVEFRHTGLRRRLPLELSLGAYRIVQEALTNVARHAGVSEAIVQASATKDALRLLIEDHGVGFNASDEQCSQGLAGMRERALSLGGQLKIQSTPRNGTRIIARLPVGGSLKRDETQA